MSLEPRAAERTTRGLHSFICWCDVSTLCGIRLVSCVVSVTKTTQVELRRGRVEVPGYYYVTHHHRRHRAHLKLNYSCRALGQSLGSKGGRRDA